MLTVDIEVSATSRRYAPDHPGWIKQRYELAAGLRSGVPGAEVRSTPVAGTKGAAEAVVVALGSAGAFTAALGAFKAWLGRDRTRTVTLTWQHDGREDRVTLDADNLDAAAMQELTRGMSRILSGEPWQTDTERS
ncbi:effector-associated constant component EACC1 [Paractinoplanes durhamensis]|uniref:Uncharacterized protein n=1 Tax=Paractinoplanes durhamensis TaxID=113563 RepID=A0ABQ3YT40_9ACTN|nr:hypothetical protein [Actinoplanes durhamensis]GIE00743.1 hypothetical protein Adu01nite_20930 [Actinoplanes durhamensis]